MTSRVTIEGMYCHASRSITFPLGVTLVVGPNGAGKSSLVAEPFAWGFFGKTLRGGQPGDAPAVEIDLPGLNVRRRKGKRTTSLEVTVGGHAVAYETTTKAQEAVETHLGLDFAGWRRTHVFSAAGVAQFSEATDAERKRLLEGLLGLDRFDAALARCRDDLKQTKSRRQGRVSSLAVLRRVYDEAKAAVDGWRAEVAEAREPPDLSEPPDIAPLEAELDRLLGLSAGQQDRQGEAIAAYSLAEQALRQAERDASSGVCRACNRPFDDRDPAALAAAVARAKVEAEKAYDWRSRVYAATDRLRDDERKATAALEDARRLRNAHDAAVAHHEDALAEALDQLEHAEARLRRADADLEAEEVADEADLLEVGLLERVERVLGLKGARALVLGHALAAIEDEANAWLDELAPGVSVELTSENGSIGLVVGGFGAGASYEGLSTGERCRVDIALLVAIASVAPQIDGLPIIFDDVFGALDTTGIEAVARLLAHIGTRRPVAVITQLDDLRDWLTPIAAQVVSL